MSWSPSDDYGLKSFNPQPGSNRLSPVNLPKQPMGAQSISTNLYDSEEKQSHYSPSPIVHYNKRKASKKKGKLDLEQIPSHSFNLDPPSSIQQNQSMNQSELPVVPDENEDGYENEAEEDDLTIPRIYSEGLQKQGGGDTFMGDGESDTSQSSTKENEHIETFTTPQYVHDDNDDYDYHERRNITTFGPKGSTNTLETVMQTKQEMEHSDSSIQDNDNNYTTNKFKRDNDRDDEHDEDEKKYVNDVIMDKEEKMDFVDIEYEFMNERKENNEENINNKSDPFSRQDTNATKSSNSKKTHSSTKTNKSYRSDAQSDESHHSMAQANFSMELIEENVEKVIMENSMMGDDV